MVDQVVDLLNSEGITFVPSGRDYLIKCLNPEHQDNNPSLRIDKLTGIGHCFACNYRVNIFKHFNKVVNYQSIRVIQLQEKIASIKSSSIGLSLPKKFIPFTRSYRNISANTYKEFEAFESNSLLENRIIFPMRDTTGKIVAFNGRHKESHIKPRYKIYPEHVTIPMFPGKITPVNNAIVLVEGIFDFLNLYDKGLKNALAILGTNALYSQHKGLNKDKISILKLHGIQRIFIMFDGDEAGRRAASLLKPELEKINFITEIIDLPDDTDPGELSQEDIKSIIEYIR